MISPAPPSNSRLSGTTTAARPLSGRIDAGRASGSPPDYWAACGSTPESVVPAFLASIMPAAWPST